MVGIHLPLLALNKPSVAIDYYLIGGGSGGNGGVNGVRYGPGGASGVIEEAYGVLVPKGVALNIRVGAGGAGVAESTAPAGTPSLIGNIQATGGNANPNNTSTGASNADYVGGTGGGVNSGGGAGSGNNGSGQTGGAGAFTSISGSSIQRGGGGGGGKGGAGGAGGGGPAAGSDNGRGTNGTVNTGSGGGGGPAGPGGGNGASGYIVIRTATSVTVTFSGGVTRTTGTVSGKNAYFITATSTTSETVTFT